MTGELLFALANIHLASGRVSPARLGLARTADDSGPMLASL